MPSTTRKPTARQKATASASEQPAPDPAPVLSTDAPGPDEPGRAKPARPANGHGDSALVELVTFPVRVTQGLIHDVAATARNPEAVAYWGGLAALAVVGVLEWPVAAAAGLGVAVAGAVRRGQGRG